MTIDLTPEGTRIIDQAIQAGPIHSPDEVVEVGGRDSSEPLRGASFPRIIGAARGCEIIKDKYRLAFGEPITRDLLHEGHRH